MPACVNWWIGVASQAFRLFEQPSLCQGYGAGGPWLPVEGQASLDKVAVEIFQAFAREVEHSPQFSSKLAQLLKQVGADGFGPLACVTRL